MELFSITVNTRTELEKESFYRIFLDKQKALHKQCKPLKFKFSASQNRVIWTCSGKLPLTSWGMSGELLRAEISEAVTAYIAKQKEQEIAARLLQEEFEFQDGEELEQVLRCFLQLLEKDEGTSAEFARRRRQKLDRTIRQCLAESAELNLDGLLAFRLRDYEQELRELAEYAVDEYMLDQQYEEFISLLKYFVYFQEPLTPLVHVIHRGGEDLLLLDGSLKPIEAGKQEGLVMERLDQEMEVEDMVVSTLISAAPARLIIHTRQPGLPVIGTLLQIFDHRAEVCYSCQECTPFIEGLNHIGLTLHAGRDYNN
ncbi:putative sporulation protein YtxC [Paenibacillus sp. F411]|uniref:Sporulation protein YtxC n=1 Tax=Paenibacillus algicola TaxID=2565926 RepID=A0A4P8XN60_9BACL|nr:MULTISPECIES: putative sporulation protein YtxC [Paenibacillus]MBO2943524.1 putative sporulation protein YtxC [Paenibacillus sp. F411]QCT03873.1 Sporulation protein YtxC [Paenibacillus algicola]